MLDRMSRVSMGALARLVALALFASAFGAAPGECGNPLRPDDASLFGGVDSARASVVTVIGLPVSDPTGVETLPKRLIATGVIAGPHRVVSTASVALQGGGIQIVVGDGDVRPARLRGVDRESNVCLIEVGGSPLGPLRRAPPQSLAIGSWVAVIANAGAGHPQVTLGQVVGRGDRVDFPYGGEVVEIDARVAPGSGGGAILNQDGEWVAIVVGQAGLAPADGAPVRGRSAPDAPPARDGILVALPVDQLDRITDDLEEYGSVRRAFLGIRLKREIEADSVGVQVKEVVPNSPAAAAGIRPGDRILAFEGDVPRSAEEMTGMVRALKPGDDVELTVARGSEIFPVHATLVAALLGDPSAARAQRTEEIRALKSELRRLEAERAKVEEQIRTIQGGGGPPRR